MGLLNSRLLSTWFRGKYDKLQRGIFPQFKVKELAAFPIKSIDQGNSSQMSLHNRIASLADHMVILHAQYSRAGTNQEREVIQRQLLGLDQQIDLLVYKLYELSDSEIALVEAEPDFT